MNIWILYKDNISYSAANAWKTKNSTIDLTHIWNKYDTKKILIT